MRRMPSSASTGSNRASAAAAAACAPALPVPCVSRMVCDRLMLQNFGPHMEQKCAVLAPSCDARDNGRPGGWPTARVAHRGSRAARGRLGSVA
eukprot:350621-Chlamydomonas_euryale.AAC.4